MELSTNSNIGNFLYLQKISNYCTKTDKSQMFDEQKNYKL